MKKVNILTKAEMKNVMGGVNCSAALDNGTTKSYLCDGSLAICQGIADANCAATVGCISASCS